MGGHDGEREKGVGFVCSGLFVCLGEWGHVLEFWKKGCRVSLFVWANGGEFWNFGIKGLGVVFVCLGERVCLVPIVFFVVVAWVSGCLVRISVVCLGEWVFLVRFLNVCLCCLGG